MVYPEKFQKLKKRSKSQSPSINPVDENFDFAIWAEAVRQQMETVLQRRYQE
ncbi:hypothetical protein [Gloeothece verrucosa]|uniref:Uncharacterized protein n=1 Tax=Gloeothece verrucosa (strain PCC 7822) TaxID=497965 RepID=E0U6V2_GLOV7|nr:hypothetical protein [Gloeothece verrucosa]ADN15989.1 hypothetical protein Cyan7822_4069 [Gloeothece verrucosa PCC 7822]